MDITEGQVEVMKQLFNDCDLNQDGKIDMAELRAAIQKLGKQDVSEELLSSLFGQLDQDESGSIGFEEFLSGFGPLLLSPDLNTTAESVYLTPLTSPERELSTPQSILRSNTGMTPSSLRSNRRKSVALSDNQSFAIQQIFSTLDKEGTGSVSLSALKSVFRTLSGKYLQDEQIDQILADYYASTNTIDPSSNSTAPDANSDGERMIEFGAFTRILKRYISTYDEEQEELQQFEQEGQQNPQEDEEDVPIVPFTSSYGRKQGMHLMDSFAKSEESNADASGTDPQTSQSSDLSKVKRRLSAVFLQPPLTRFLEENATDSENEQGRHFYSNSRSDSFRSEGSVDIQTKIDSLENEKKFLSATINVLKSELYHTREEQNAMLDTLEQMKAKVRESKRRVAQAEKVKDQNKELLNNIDTLKEELEQIKKQQKETKKTITKLTEERDQLTKTLNEKLEELNNSQMELATKSRPIRHANSNTNVTDNDESSPSKSQEQERQILQLQQDYNALKKQLEETIVAKDTVIQRLNFETEQLRNQQLEDSALLNEARQNIAKLTQSLEEQQLHVLQQQQQQQQQSIATNSPQKVVSVARVANPGSLFGELEREVERRLSPRIAALEQEVDRLSTPRGSAIFGGEDEEENNNSNNNNNNNTPGSPLIDVNEERRRKLFDDNQTTSPVSLLTEKIGTLETKISELEQQNRDLSQTSLQSHEHTRRVEQEKSEIESKMTRVVTRLEQDNRTLEQEKEELHRQLEKLQSQLLLQQQQLKQTGSPSSSRKNTKRKTNSFSAQEKRHTRTSSNSSTGSRGSVSNGKSVAIRIKNEEASGLLSNVDNDDEEEEEDYVEQGEDEERGYQRETYPPPPASGSINQDAVKKKEEGCCSCGGCVIV